MNRQDPIGIFDSGLGGLTVVKAVRERMPQEDVIYYGDTAHVPYGSKSQETILSFTRDASASSSATTSSAWSSPATPPRPWRFPK